MELINVADPEKLFPEKIREAVRGGKPFAASHPEKRKAEIIAKLSKRCHPRESGGPEVLKITGFPLPRE